MNRNREPAERVITEYIKVPPLAMYDLGVGINSEYLTLKECYPSMRLFGCEPHHEEYNRLMGVFPGHLVNVAISDAKGEKPMYLTELGNGGSSLFGRDPTKAPVWVDTWTLDQFDEVAGKPDRILLWMDIEGSELAALRGGSNLMQSGRVKWISVEVFGEPPNLPDYPSQKDIHTHLNNLGYTKVRDYNRQGSHWDEIYVLATELKG